MGAPPARRRARGGLPKDKTELSDEVNYAIYLLTGKDPAGFAASNIPPRWTIDD
jgi:hypothetical protein